MACDTSWVEPIIYAAKHTREHPGASEFGAPPSGQTYPFPPGYRPLPAAQSPREIAVERAGRGRGRVS